MNACYGLLPDYLCMIKTWESGMKTISLGITNWHMHMVKVIKQYNSTI